MTNANIRSEVVALVGFAGAGKDTVGLHLKERGYFPIAFADPIKDAVSIIFQWDRDLLSGRTPESRAWRETVDEFWAEKLGIPHFTPRFAMTNFGTDVMRRHFHNDIWMLNTERKIRQANSPVVITDCRHVTELRFLERLGARVYRVKRGPEPRWFEIALQANQGDLAAREKMEKVHRIHISEWDWIGQSFHGTIDNDGDIYDLNKEVERVIFGG